MTTSVIKLITFDAYNTLFKPRGSLSAQYVEEAARYGIKVTKNEITDHFGQAYRKQQLKAPFYGIKQGMTPQEWWKELVYATFSSAGVHPKELDSNFDQLYNALYNRFTTAAAYSIFPDVVSTLEELKTRGFKMGVITNSDERVAKVVKNLKLDKYFDFVLASADVGYEKPDKVIFDRALKIAGDVSAENALHVGDDLNKDYFGAAYAGWHSVLLARSKLSYEDFSPAMVEDTSVPLHRPRCLMSLHDLYPYISTLCDKNKKRT
ncbi:hypothetical protein RMCBS344292_13809 [Rhizopus microsporus]|nr:hypothetical protein RMCBS344292_13809 [Rhizopus microsporus]